MNDAERERIRQQSEAARQASHQAVERAKDVEQRVREVRIAAEKRRLERHPW